MRELKFRAYDRDNKKMVYSDNINCEDGYWFNVGHMGTVCMLEENYWNKFGKEHTFNKCLDNIMQYTGLKDRDSKEIYEGDIVTIDLHDEEESLLMFLKNNNKYSIEYRDASFVLINVEGELDSYLGDCSENMLNVEGNIFDNPELLRGENNE